MGEPSPPQWTCARVAARLAELSGRTAASLPRQAVPASFRPSAVLLLIVCDGGGPSLVLTERAATLRSHPSEICLPGGRVEAGESIVDAALREAVEELGIDLHGVQVMGELDEGWTGTAHTVGPVVAWHDGPLPPFLPAADEVAAVLSIPLTALADPAAHSVEVVEFAGHVYHDDVIEVDGCRLYGPTADAVVDLLAWLRREHRDRTDERARDLVHFAAHALGEGPVSAPER
jgi:8-oxo-dGTP pyrophosphatase MutT (NUDIX family)